MSVSPPRRRGTPAGQPFVVFPKRPSGQGLFPLHAGLQRITVGRGAGNEVSFGWDNQVARVHAEIERFGGAWTVLDHAGRGTWVNGERVSGRRRLADGDVIKVGETSFEFRVPAPDETLPQLTPTQRRVLEALCRPLSEGQFSRPAGDEQIAEELFVSVEAARAHVRALLVAFGERDRVALARRAVRAGLVE